MVILAGEKILTPLGLPLENLPRPLEEAVYQERVCLSKPQEKIDAPFYQMASHAVDHIMPARAQCVDRLILAYSTDVTRFLDPHISQLRFRQTELWLSVHALFKDLLSFAVTTTSDLKPVEVFPHEKEAFQRFLRSKDIFFLSGVVNSVHVTHSLILSFLLMEGCISAEQVFQCALLEELEQNKQWQKDCLAIHRQESILNDIKVLSSYAKMLTV